MSLCTCSVLLKLQNVLDIVNNKKSILLYHSHVDGGHPLFRIIYLETDDGSDENSGKSSEVFVESI